MAVFVCNHCGEKVKNNGGSAREAGLIKLNVCVGVVIGTDLDTVTEERFYCLDCAKSIALELLEEI